MTKDVRTLILGHVTEVIRHQANVDISNDCNTFYDPKDGSVELKIWADHTASVKFTKQSKDDFVEMDFPTFEDALKAFELAWSVRNELRETLGKFFQ